MTIIHTLSTDVIYNSTKTSIYWPVLFINIFVSFQVLIWDVSVSRTDVSVSVSVSSPLLFSLKFTCDESLLKRSALASSIDASTIIRAEYSCHVTRPIWTSTLWYRPVWRHLCMRKYLMLKSKLSLKHAWFSLLVSDTIVYICNSRSSSSSSSVFFTALAAPPVSKKAKLFDFINPRLSGSNTIVINCHMLTLSSMYLP